MRIKKEERNIIMIALIVVIITVLIVIFSEQAFNAALEGLKVWWEIVFPSLLPFFIIAEILMGLGVVHFLGALLEPLMQPLFKVPGVGAFAMAMGLASGYPIGAKITSNLRRKKMCSKTEAERLISFTNTADPLFMIGAVAVGMFHRPELGIIIAGAHYISSLLVGFLMRFYRGDETKKYVTATKIKQTNIFISAVQDLITARKNDGRTIGELLGDSVRESINTLLLIGGLIILFSVVTKIIIVTGLSVIISRILIYILQPFGLTSASILPLISGFFEITNGANLASQSQAPLLEQVIITNIIIAWSGLSVHAQVATMINGTDINLKPYLFARVLQAILAGVSTIFIIRLYPENVITTFLPFVSEVTRVRDFLIIILILIIAILAVAIVLSLLIYLFKKIKIIIF